MEYELRKFIQREFKTKLGFAPSLKDIKFTMFNGTPYCKFEINGISYLFDGWNVYLTGAEYTKSKTKKLIGINFPEGE